MASRPSKPDLVRRTLALAQGPALTPEIWFVAGFVLVATALLQLALLPDFGEQATAVLGVAAVVRIAAIFWLTALLIRAMAGSPAPWRPGIAYLRLSGYLLLTVVGGTVIATLADVALGPSARLADRWLAGFVAGTLWALALVRLSAWQAALALGDRSLGPGGAWRGLKGAAMPLVRALLWLVTPFFAVHHVLALLLAGSEVELSGVAVAAIAILDGLVSLGQLILSCALAVAAWEVAHARNARLEKRRSRG